MTRAALLSKKRADRFIELGVHGARGFFWFVICNRPGDVSEARKDVAFLLVGLQSATQLWHDGRWQRQSAAMPLVHRMPPA